MNYRAHLHHFIFAIGALLLAWHFSFLFSSELVPSEDLPAHIAVTSLLREQLLHGRLVFYDSSYFSGWPAFAFYGFGFSLLSALLSFPLSVISAEPVSLASNILLFFGLFGLAPALYRLAFVLLPQRNAHLFDAIKPLLALGSLVFCLWVYQHDGQFYGLGAGAYLAVGLAPQLLAHVFLLLSLSYFFESSEEQSFGSWKLPLCLSALICIHLLTAAYAFALLLVSALVVPRLLRSALRAIAVALLLSSPWLLPLLQHISQFTLPDPYPPQGDLLALLFRYPLHELLSALRGQPIETLRDIQFFPVLFGVLVFVLAFHREVIEARRLRSAFIALLLLNLILGSSYVAASLPLGFHYYRFLSNTILILLAVFLASFSLLSIRRSAKERALEISPRRSAALAFTLVILAISILRLPSLELVQLQTLQGRWITKAQHSLMDQLAKSEHRGRVLVEYIDDYKRVPYLSAHLLETMIPERTGREVAGGLFVESALRFRFTAVPAALLSAKLFSPYLVFSSAHQGTAQQHLEELQALGIDTIVAGSADFISQLEALGLDARSFGPYRLFELAVPSPPRIRRIAQPVLGFYDPTERLPFYLLAFYFAAQGGLLSDSTVLEISDLDTVPAHVKIILTTDQEDRSAEALYLPLEIAARSVDHYRPHYEIAKSVHRFRSLAAMFDTQPQFWEPFTSATNALSEESAKVDWDQGAQRFTITGLSPGELYALNYSFTPFLRCHGCVLYRGGSNEIVIEARQESAEIRFSYFSEASSWLGILAALLGGWGLWFFYGSRQRRSQQQRARRSKAAAS